MILKLRFLTPILVLLLLAGGASTVAAQTQSPDVLVLVRHAETADDGTRDPALSDDGLARADRLAAMLASAGVTHVHSSPYRRTQQTAAPIAAALGRDVLEYDPRALPAVAAALRGEAGRHLVVGHSNTTPMLVDLLGGDPGPPIPEDEYGRIYVLTQGADGTTTTVVLRY